MITVTLELAVDEERHTLLVDGEALGSISLAVMRRSDSARDAWGSLIGTAALLAVERAAMKLGA